MKHVKLFEEFVDEDSRSLDQLEIDISMFTNGPQNSRTDAAIDKLEKIYRKKGGKKSIAEIKYVNKALK